MHGISRSRKERSSALWRVRRRVRGQQWIWRWRWWMMMMMMMTTMMPSLMNLKWTSKTYRYPPKKRINKSIAEKTFLTTTCFEKAFIYISSESNHPSPPTSRASQPARRQPDASQNRPGLGETHRTRSIRQDSTKRTGLGQTDRTRPNRPDATTHSLTYLLAPRPDCARASQERVA